MKYLLDTHVFLWWINDDPLISAEAREIIEEGEHTLYLSAASGWEMAVKAKLGKLKVPDDLEAFVLEQMFKNAISLLPVQMNHALHVHTLPNFHRDPFDRIIIAQAQLEGLPLLSADSQMGKYRIEVIW